MPIFFFFFFFWNSAVRSRSMTPITWQVAVDDKEQRPLLQDILEAAVDDQRQAALDVEEQRHSCKTSSKQPSMGIMSRENSRGGFPLPSSRFLLSSVLLLYSSFIDTSMPMPCPYFVILYVELIYACWYTRAYRCLTMFVQRRWMLNISLKVFKCVKNIFCRYISHFHAVCFGMRRKLIELCTV